MQEFQTYYEFIELLEDYNTTLDSNVIVCFIPPEEGRNIKDFVNQYQRDNVMILNFLRNESNHILYTTDAALAEKLKLESYKFYSYYKPSYLNGFENLADKEINIHHLQAFEGLC